jgi:hypothetical protein
MRKYALVVVVLAGLSLALPSGRKLSAQSQSHSGPTVVHAQFASAPPLRDTVPIPASATEHRIIPLRLPFTPQGSSGAPDGALQTTILPLVNTTAGENFLGLGKGFSGFSVCCAPPDTNGAVGGPVNTTTGLSTQFVQWVNLEFAVFDTSSGTTVTGGGPTAGNTLFQSLGGPCAAHNDGDPIAQYDKAAQRWVLMQPVFESPYQLCVAVSKTNDAVNGGWNTYAFPMTFFPDYPKLSVWSDGYYVSMNSFNGNSFAGANACALNRSAMLTGGAASAICFQQSSSVASLLPSDLDGTTAPPSGSPDYFINFGSNSLRLWKFHADFTTPGNSTFTGPTTLSVAAFNEACSGGSCIPQAGTHEKLDSLGDRLMYRFAYRNFTSYESFVVNHSVAVGSGRNAISGIRWYELRNNSPGTGTPSVYQQSTFAPDSNYRWMGSIAENGHNDIAVGFSESSSQIHPQINYTGRCSTDALNTLQSEALIEAGGGSQLPNLSRWGDYSSIAIDPANNSTFWYTTEYLQSNGTFNWSTRIASFTLCGH